MRLLLAATVILIGSTAALAGSPSPAFSTAIVTTAPTYPCHWIFLPGTPVFDDLHIDVELRDGVGAPLPACNCTAVFVPVSGNVSACPGEGAKTQTTNAGGLTTFSFEELRGCGKFRIDIQDAGGVVLLSVGSFSMTSSDLTGDGHTDIFDLGVFAGGLPPAYDPCVDYTCNGLVDVFDLGVLAAGLLGSC